MTTNAHFVLYIPREGSFKIGQDFGHMLQHKSLVKWIIEVKFAGTNKKGKIRLDYVR